MPSSNEVKLNGATIQSVRYINGSFVITDGEDSKLPPTISNTGSEWTIKVEADRKGSKAVADKYVTAVGGIGHLAADGGDNRPGELNFFYGLTVEFKVGSAIYAQTLYLGQGHYALTNNWWFGGRNYLSDGSQLCVIGSNEIQQVLKIELSTSSFKLTPK